MAYEDTSVKYMRFNRDNFVEPDMSQPNSWIDVLNQVLCTGYGQKTLDTLVVSSGVATATISGGHGYSDYNDHADDALEERVGPILEIEGATPAGLNGEHRVTLVDANSFSFITTEADGAATGTITSKVPPLGWERTFYDSGNNQAVFKSTNPLVDEIFIHVEDAGTTNNSRVWAYMQGAEDASSATSLTNTFGGFYVPRYSTLYATNADWAILGDDKTVYILNNSYQPHLTPLDHDNASLGVTMFSFGYFDSFKLADQYNFLIMGGTLSANGAPCNYFGQLNLSTYKVLARRADQTTLAPECMHEYTVIGGDNYLGMGGQFCYAVYPHATSEDFLYRPYLYFTDTGQDYLRGKHRGLAQSLHSNGYTAFPHGRVATFNGNPFLFWSFRMHPTYGYQQSALLYLVGPW
jgi:hypothetical protein